MVMRFDDLYPCMRGDLLHFVITIIIVSLSSGQNPNYSRPPFGPGSHSARIMEALLYMQTPGPVAHTV